MDQQTVSPVSVDHPVEGWREDAGMASSTPTVPKHAAVPESESATQSTKWWGHARDFSLWLRDVGLGGSGYIMLAVVVVAGFTASFIGLHDFGVHMMKYSDHQAWLIPIAIDGADIGLSVNALRAAMNGRAAMLNRVMIVACTSISSWINYTHIEDQAGKYIASLLPILAVILLESLMSEARKAYERRNDNVRPRLSLMRWVYDFKGTNQILRAYYLGLPLPEGFAEAAEVVEASKGGRKRKAAPKAKPQEVAEQTPAAKVAKPTPAPVVDVAAPEEMTAEMPVVPAEEKGSEVIDFNPTRPEWVTDEMTATDAVFGFLNRHGAEGTGGARLTRWVRACGYEVNDDFGRSMLRRWKKQQEDRATGSGTAPAGSDDRVSDPIAVGQE